MITTQPQGHQTGQYSRIVNPRTRIGGGALRARIHAAHNPPSPMRNMLAGVENTGLLCRFRAWLRGE
jgi:hypothetical protein